MPETINLGTARSQPGSIEYGHWDALSHPTGHVEFLPVIIAQGLRDGPCIWLTAGIHGVENAGPCVLHDLITPELVDNLQGTIIALPSLCPVGVRVSKYVPYLVEENPNRLWPDGKPKPAKPDPEKRPPFSLEAAYERLFSEIQATGDYLIDYHNAWIGSISFAFRDRVLYRADKNPDRNKAAAARLASRLDEILKAYGHTIVNEFPVERYIKHDLHRSTSGSVLLNGKIPAFTVELGTGLVPDWNIVQAAVAGTRNVLRITGMLSDEMEEINGIKLASPGFSVRRTESLRMPQAGIARHLKEAGEMVSAGEPVAELSDIWGRPLPERLLISEHDGFVLGRSHGIYYYPGDTVIHLAIRDEEPLIGPYPEDFFKDN